MTAPDPGRGNGNGAADLTGAAEPTAAAPPSIAVAAGIGPGTSGWWLRLVHAVVCVGTVVVALQVDAGSGVLTVIGFALVFLAGATMVAPQSIAGTLLILGAMTAHLLGRDQGITVLTGVLAALLLAVHQLSGICAAVPARSIVHRDALRPALQRFALCAGVVLVAVVVSLLV